MLQKGQDYSQGLGLTLTSAASIPHTTDTPQVLDVDIFYIGAKIVLGSPIPTMFGNTGISVLKELNTGIDTGIRLNDAITDKTINKDWRNLGNMPKCNDKRSAQL